MERLNLNVPSDLRRELRAMARRRKRREGELARELLARALKQTADEEFFARFIEAENRPEYRKRVAQILADCEALRG